LRQGRAARIGVVTLDSNSRRRHPRPAPYLNPQAEHLLDWFHLTIRITVLTQLAKGPRCAPQTAPDVAAQLQRVKWFLSHGNVFRARQTVDDLTADLTDADASVESGKLAKAVREFGGYLAANASATRTTGSAGLPARPPPPRSSNPRSTRSSASAWSRNSRCGGAPAARTCYCRFAPGSQRHPRRRLPTLVPRLHPTPTGRTRPHNLPRFVPLSMAAPPTSTKTSLQQALSARARERGPELAGGDVRYRGAFAYVTGRLPDGDTQPLMGCGTADQPPAGASRSTWPA
jgi:hypothetical protein